MRLVLFAFFVFPLIISAQKIPDSLKEKSFAYLGNKYNQAKNISDQNLYADVIIAKAKLDKDLKNLCDGYYMKAYINFDSKRIAYADSIIITSINNSTVDYPTLGFELKANFFYKKRDFKSSLKYTLDALKYSKKHKNEYSIFNSNHLINFLNLEK